MFLLGLVYVVLIGVAFAAGAGIVLIGAIARVLFVSQVSVSDKIALAAIGAKEVMTVASFFALILRGANGEGVSSGCVAAVT
ncbi:MAG: hypothetical protein M3Y09_17350 [Actinomycetota bacterium]|nr:hypothetical protein [Actinomycetota bacterium]